LSNFRDNVLNTDWRVSHNVIASSSITISILPQATEDTSTGSYIDIYLSPNFNAGDNFNLNTDCQFNYAPNSAICIR